MGGPLEIDNSSVVSKTPTLVSPGKSTNIRSNLVEVGEPFIYMKELSPFGVHRYQRGVQGGRIGQRGRSRYVDELEHGWLAGDDALTTSQKH